MAASVQSSADCATFTHSSIQVSRRNRIRSKLYTPFNNRECLYCHLGARSFQSNAVHMAIMDSLKSNEMSCVTSGCHDVVHDIDGLSKAKFWSPIANQ